MTINVNVSVGTNAPWRAKVCGIDKKGQQVFKQFVEPGKTGSFAATDHMNISIGEVPLAPANAVEGEAS
jgi:hypothetical protein